MTEQDGNVNHFQVHTYQNDVDDYTWTLFVSRKDAWVKLFEIHYHRTQS
jgi:hypothetical protein